MEIKISHPKEDMQGNQRENIFIVIDGNQEFLGSGYVYPKLTPEMTPDAPLNIFIEMHLDEEYINSQIGERLFKLLKKRAQALTELVGQQSYLYFGSEDSNHPYFDFLKKMNFEVEAKTYLMSKIIHLTEMSIPKSVRCQQSNDVSESVKKVFLPLYNAHFLRQIDDEQLHQMVHEPHFQNFTIYENDTFIGNMILYSVEENGVKKGKVENLFIIKEKRQLGYGKYLLNLAESYFQNVFIKECVLEVWSKNLKAVDFYSRHGFKEIKRTEHYLGTYINRN